jgi:alkylation response protein AidB-like acyl-CoA dehydrogenase
MDFSWTEAQLALRAEMVALGKASLSEGVIERDQEGSFSKEAWTALAHGGVMGLAMPKGYGGAEHDILTAMIAMEGLGYGCRDNGLLLGLNAHIWTASMPINEFGTDAQKQRYLPSLIDGTAIAAHCNTEPDAGSDGHALTTRAEPNDDGYVLNGQKSYITLGPVADVFVVFAMTRPDRGKWGISAFIVDRDTPGFTVGPTRSKMGLRSVPFSDLFFEDCHVPSTALLGSEGSGTAVSTATLEWDRCCILSCHIGAMERQLEEAVTYAKKRKQFGQRIGKFQAVSHRLADMKLQIEAARLLLYRVGWLKQEGKSAALAGTLAKLFISEAFVDNSLSAIRTQGGRGYLTETEVERDLRDAVGGILYAGTSDIQRNIIARFLGLPA